MNQGTEPVVFCRKCFIRGVDEETFFAQLRAYVEGIDPEQRVNSEEYAKRLEKCADCDSLFMGMCRHGGDYVEMRAALKKNICAGVHPKWGKAE